MRRAQPGVLPGLGGKERGVRGAAKTQRFLEHVLFDAATVAGPGQWGSVPRAVAGNLCLGQCGEPWGTMLPLPEGSR